MAYLSRFSEADLLVAQLGPTIPTITDSMIISNLAGMLSVKAVTAYELAIKDILIDFSRKKNVVFGIYVDSSLCRLNGKITYQDLQDNIKKYGVKYVNKFKKEVAKSASKLSANHIDLLSSYDNLIKSRHSFVHKGVVTLSWDETYNNYVSGKQVIASLDLAMRR